MTETLRDVLDEIRSDGFLSYADRIEAALAREHTPERAAFVEAAIVHGERLEGIGCDESDATDFQTTSEQRFFAAYRALAAQKERTDE